MGTPEWILEVLPWGLPRVGFVGVLFAFDLPLPLERDPAINPVDGPGEYFGEPGEGTADMGETGLRCFFEVVRLLVSLVGSFRFSEGTLLSNP